MKRGVEMERRHIEKRWAQEKYHVMFHSQRHYNSIRMAMREKQEVGKIEQLIEEALQIPPTDGSRSNACQHMWGYFKKVATVEEKRHYMNLLDKKAFADLLNYLYVLSQKYAVTYLLDSVVLKPKI